MFTEGFSMDQTQKLLQSILENARTGANACGQLMRRTDDESMRVELQAQKDRYESFAAAAENALTDVGEPPHSQSPISRAGMWMGIQLNTLTDATRSHIADIAIQGATMGVIGMTRERGGLPDADVRAHNIAAGFITAQQEAIERFKSFL